MTATNALVALNVIAFIWQYTTGGLSSDRGLLAHGALLGVLVTEQGQWWRIITGGFLHGGLLHIATNMFALFQVGTFVEYALGPVRLLLIYFCALIGSGLTVVTFNHDAITVGASGAIFGLFGALVAIGIRLGTRGRSLIAQTIPIIVLNLIIGFALPNISNAAHLGGLATGFVTGFAFFMLRRPAAYAPVADAGPPVDVEPPARDADDSHDRSDPA